MTTPPPAPVPPLPLAPKSRFGLLRSSGWAMAAVLLGLPLAAAITAVTLLHNEAGTAWVLQQMPFVKVTAPRGALLGEHFGAERINISWASGSAGVDIEDVDLRGARWRWWLRPGVWAGLQADTLTARLVQVRSGPSTPGPLAAPGSLHLPLEIQVARVEVAELRIDQLEPLRKVSAAAHLGAADGTLNRFEQLSADWDRLHASGRAQIGSTAPFALEAAVDLASAGGPVWAASVQAAGPLATFDLTARLRGEAPAGREAPALDARVQVLPFAPWALGTLDASTQALDLSALSSRAPQTRISGHAIVTSQGKAEPIGAQIHLENALPGRWNEGRLPLRRVQVALRADPSRLDRVEVHTFDLQFGDAANAAGRWTGSGVWQGTSFTLDTRMTALRPQWLDGRAAAMVLGGPLALAIEGLPSPAGGTPAATPAGGVDVGFRGALEGTLDGLKQPVSLALEGSASAQRVQVRKLHAVSGRASAELTASAERTGGQRWLARSQGKLVDFDPVPWFPGVDGSAWRKGPHRLNATWKLDLSLPGNATSLHALQLLQTLQGEGSVQVADSLLAGVPLQAKLQIGQDLQAAKAQRSEVQGELQLGSNRITLEGHGDPSGSGETDRWRAELHAGALAELAPLAALHPALAAWAPRKGSLQASVSADGRWPQLHTEADVTLKDLRLGELTVAGGTAGWRLNTGRQQPIDLHAELTDLALGERRVALVRGEISGTLRAHRLQVDIASPMSPPAVVERMLGLRTLAGTQARLSADGSWEAAPGGGGTWSGTLQKLSAGVWDGRTARNTGADASWVDVGTARGELEFSADGGVVAAHASAGSATLAGGGALRWNDVRYRAGAQRPDLTLQAEVLPIAVAPLLQRAQTGVQWGGDLRVSALIDIRAGERFDADIAVRRHDGDLHVIENNVTQVLGLTDLELSLAAHDGVWLLKPLFAGRSLGAISGALTARTTPQRRWPEPEAPIDGALQVQVPDLAVWARWVPPGWRLQGELNSTAGIGGRFGAPEYTGELRGTGIGVRNLLQGLDFTDGRVHIALKGDRAEIESMSIRGGGGTLSAEGQATFGANPSAQLKVTAQRFRVLGRIDRQLITSGQATLSLQPGKLRLDGRVGVDSGLFDVSRNDAPSLDDDVNVRREGVIPDDKAEAAAVSPIARTATVAIDIDLGSKLHLRGRGIDTKLNGQLKITSPGGRLAVNGTVNTEDGTYAAYGQKLEIERGLVAFSGPVGNPRLDILALRPNLDTRVGVAITGNALTPRIRLYSEPEMSETDKLSWLVLGRGPDGLGRTDTALLQGAALALLSGEGEGPTDKVLKALGIDDLSVRQTDGDVRDTVITLGKQLNRRWYVGYERGVNATSGSWQIIYRIAQRFTLRAQSGEDNSLDVIWTWRFGEDPLSLGYPSVTKSKPKPP